MEQNLRRNLEKCEKILFLKETFFSGEEKYLEKHQLLVVLISPTVTVGEKFCIFREAEAGISKGRVVED